VLADSPDTREGFSKYLAEITYFDSQVGELISLLDQSGQRDNTLVIVLSEQGNSFPFANGPATTPDSKVPASHAGLAK
jgi:N-sulfoglucosamine sulfohydrolase